MEKNGAVLTAQMKTFVALPLQTLNLLRILNKMTEAVGYVRDCFWVDDCHRHENDWARWHKFKDIPSKAKANRDYADDHSRTIRITITNL